MAQLAAQTNGAPLLLVCRRLKLCVMPGSHLLRVLYDLLQDTSWLPLVRGTKTDSCGTPGMACMHACMHTVEWLPRGASGLNPWCAFALCLVVGAVSREITFKTDPEKGDYELETGASRNFESWTDKQATEDEHKKARCVSCRIPGRY